MHMAEFFVDVRGQTCPVPLVETRKAIRKAVSGDVIRIRGTHPSSREEVPMAADSMRIEAKEALETARNRIAAHLGDLRGKIDLHFRSDGIEQPCFKKRHRCLGEKGKPYHRVGRRGFSGPGQRPGARKERIPRNNASRGSGGVRGSGGSAKSRLFRDDPGLHSTCQSGNRHSLGH